MNKSLIATVAGVVLVFGLASFTVLDTKVYEIGAEQAAEEILEKIESTKGKVVIDSFADKPESVKFIDENLIEIVGEHKSFGYGAYQVDLMEMTVYQDHTLGVLDSEKYNELFRSEYGLILTFKDNSPGLFHQSIDGTINKVSGNFIPSESPELQMSRNGEKLIYLVKESAQMATYSLKTARKKVVPGTLSETVLSDFHKSVSLSPDGGYFMIFDGEGVFGEHSVNVYGSDSGRKYAEEIQGTSPTWSPDGKRLAFIYSGQLENPGLLTDTRIGYIKFPEREIVYFDKVSDEYILGDHLYWNSSGNTLSFSRSEIATDLTELHTYNVIDGGLYSFVIEESNGTFPQTVTVGDSRIALYWDETQSLQVYDVEGVSQSLTERIDTICGFDSNSTPYVMTDGNILFYKENQLIIQNGTKREVLKIEGLRQVMMHPEMKWIVAGVEKDGIYELNILAQN